MKNKIRWIVDILLYCLYEIYEQRKVICLILLIPLAESKAIFYNYNYKIKAALFFGEERWVCNVVEDYSNIIIFGVVFYFLAFMKSDIKIRNVSAFLFILNALDLIHLGLLDMQYLVIAKLVLAYVIYYLWSKLKHSY